jgi:hypothetical protein
MDYATTVEPLWSLFDKSGTNTCLDCHDGVTTKPDLTSWKGLMIGVGSETYPNSFITPTQGQASFKEAIVRIINHPASFPYHKQWKLHKTTFQSVLIPWIDEGATEASDVTPPVFDPAELADSALYSIRIEDANRVEVSFPHASDPESMPFVGSLPGDHLEYRVYGGMDANSIDWDTPLRKLDRLYFPFWKSSFDLSVDWPHDTGVFVVRAVDLIGNQSLAEVELSIERTGS